MNRKHVLMGVSAIVLAALLLGMSRLMRRDELFKQSKFAIDRGDIVQLRQLLQQGAPADGVDGAFIRGTPLCWASERGDLGMMRLLIRRGADVNKQSTEGETALMWARGPQAVQLLVNAGANPLLRAGGSTAWDLAKAQKDEQSAAILWKAAQRWRAKGATSTRK